MMARGCQCLIIHDRYFAFCVNAICRCRPLSVLRTSRPAARWGVPGDYFRLLRNDVQLLAVEKYARMVIMREVEMVEFKSQAH